MSAPSETASARQRLSQAGMRDEDLAWLESHGWSDTAIPPITSPDDALAYKRRETLLNNAIANLGVTERGESLEGKLAATMGARQADWRERGDDEEDR